MKPFTREAFSPLVVSVTVRSPGVAKSFSVMFTVAVVALVTVTVLTVMSPPKDAVVTPLEKCVLWPVTATSTFDCPCCAVLGVSELSAAGPAVTEKPFVTTSAPVVTVTVRPPVKAVGLIVMLAVAD